MARFFCAPISFVWILAACLIPRVEGQNAGGTSPAETTGGGQAQRLPLLQDEIPEEFREFLPLPFGVSLNYVHQSLPLSMVDTAVTIPGFALPPGLVRGGSVKAVTNSVVARIDAWLLPFLNIYATAGRFHGTAQEFAMDLAAPVPLPIPPTVSYKGSTQGAGITGAFGYRHFFASYDCNWNWAKPDVTNKIEIRSQGLRGGVHIASGGIRARIFLGAIRMDILDRVKGTVLLTSGAPATFDVKVQAKKSWSPVAGADLEFSRHFSLTAEVAFGSTKQIIIAPGFRF
jgi:hypothetical protein